MTDNSSPQSTQSKLWQLFILLVLGITWGSSFILMKQGMKGFEPIEVAVIRLVFAFIVIFPFLLPEIKKIPREKYIWLALAGWVGNGIPAFLFALGISKIDSSLGGIINSTTPIFTLIVGVSFFGLTYKRSALIGVLIGLCGAIYLIVSGYKGGGQSNFVYALFPLMGSILYGFSNNIIKFKLKDLKPAVITSGAFAALIPVLLPTFFLLQIPQKAALDELHFTAFMFCALLGMFGTSLAVLVYNYLIKTSSIIFAASVTYIIPVFAMAWGFLLGEQITIHYFIGLAIIVCGLWIVNRAK